MIMVIGGGILLFGLFLLFGRLWGGATPDYALTAKLFIPVWALVALANMWIGVTRAGYPLRDEMPILVIVLAVPMALATLVIWRLSR